MDISSATAASTAGIVSQQMGLVGLKQNADSEQQAVSLLEQATNAVAVQQTAAIAAAGAGKGLTVDTIA